MDGEYCAICGGNLGRHIVCLGEQPLANKYPTAQQFANEFSEKLKIYMCDGCRYLYIPCSIDRNFFFEDYYYASSVNRELVSHFNTFAAELKKADRKKILDIGSNDGTLLENFKKKKTKVNLYDLNLQKCKKCGLCQIQDVINPSILYKDYLYQSNTSSYLDTHFSNYARKVSKFLKLKKNSQIVDIGSNDGLLLSKFKKIGHKVIGIEPASQISKIANKKLKFLLLI